MALTMLSAVITGLLTRHAKTAWSGVKITVVYIIVVFAGALFYIIGKLPPTSEPSTAASTHATVPPIGSARLDPSVLNACASCRNMLTVATV